MKKYALYSALAFAIIIVLIELPAILDALFSFLLAGSIPGTTYSLSPSVMFICTILILSVLTATSLVDRFSLETPKRTPTKKRTQKSLPKRRYRHI